MGNAAMTEAPNLALAVRDAKRELLLRAARDEFVERGLEGATMRGIALRAGCTTGAIYPLFDSKEAVYAALLGQSLERLDARVAQAVAGAAGPAAQVGAACRAFVDYYLAHRFEINLGLYAFRGLKRQGVGKDSDRALNLALQGVLNRIAVPLAAHRRSSVSAAQPLVALLFSQMIGALVLQVAGRLDVLGTQADALLDLMLAQIVGSPPAARRPPRSPR